MVKTLPSPSEGGPDSQLLRSPCAGLHVTSAHLSAGTITQPRRRRDGGSEVGTGGPPAGHLSRGAIAPIRLGSDASSGPGQAWPLGVRGRRRALPGRASDQPGLPCPQCRLHSPLCSGSYPLILRCFATLLGVPRDSTALFLCAPRLADTDLARRGVRRANSASPQSDPARSEPYGPRWRGSCPSRGGGQQPARAGISGGACPSGARIAEAEPSDRPLAR
jgi:hypothetical protein